MPATITIELKALRFFANHGWHSEEAVVGTEFDVSISATFLTNGAVTTIDDTVDYTRMYTLTKEIFAKREKLLETVAQNIAAAIEAEFKNLQHLQIAIIKLAPPIASFIGNAGITYTKTF